MEPILITSALFIILSFILTPKTAKYLLAGYNTMSKEKQELYDIKNIVRILNNSLRIVALIILIGAALYQWSGLEIIRDIFVMYLPLVFLLGVNIYTKKKYSTDPIKPFDIIIPIAVLIFVILITL
ncbi:DUF3784 domain-containing protein [Myroides profundi]|uniref:DUF3784 domain-containing protein n=1 Tax=Myroides profundi TaxID=480520 RepID=A0AAJ4W2Q1_MYRPR|nr:DUF3784 domain-containing protein [Myroides profundi]AJH14024.1 hypothetical protein MPR_0831 [Myroides profundi]SEQ46016.1 protein of unknown function [Myroides profundi]